MAGASGLYVALILKDLGIPYKILEARDRVGGRLFTHTFEDKTGAPYNYYDVGAMRFPEILPMSRVFHLFHCPPLNSEGIELSKKLTRYYFTGSNTLLSYNGVTVPRTAVPPGDPFKADAVINHPKAHLYIAAGYKAIMDDVIAPFATRLLDDLQNNTDDGWKYMMEFDHYSMRAYMSITYRPDSKLGLPDAPLPTDVVNWCETFDKSTGSYDRALSETVLQAIAFGWQPATEGQEQTEWWCIECVFL